MKKILLLLLISGCSGPLQELKDRSKAQDAMLGRALQRIKTLEDEQDEMWVEHVRMELTLEAYQSRLERLECRQDNGGQDESTNSSR